MGLRRFRYFVTVAEEMSLNRAAQKLHMPQSPLSSQIMHDSRSQKKRPEALFGRVQLLARIQFQNMGQESLGFLQVVNQHAYVIDLFHAAFPRTSY